MSTSSNPHPVPVRTQLAKLAALIAITAALGWLAQVAGIAAETRQAVAVCTFS